MNNLTFKKVFFISILLFQDFWNIENLVKVIEGKNADPILLIESKK